MERRMVEQFLTCLNRLTPENNRGDASVLILAATNQPVVCGEAQWR